MDYCIQVEEPALEVHKIEICDNEGFNFIWHPPYHSYSISDEDQTSDLKIMPNKVQ